MLRGLDKTLSRVPACQVSSISTPLTKAAQVPWSLGIALHDAASGIVAGEQVHEVTCVPALSGIKMLFAMPFRPLHSVLHCCLPLHDDRASTCKPEALPYLHTVASETAKNTWPCHTHDKLATGGMADLLSRQQNELQACYLTASAQETMTIV